MKKLLSTLGILLLLLSPLSVILAQGPGGTGVEYGDDGYNVDDEGVPFDGGISLLLAAGAGLGAKKIRDQRKKKQDRKKASAAL